MSSESLVRLGGLSLLWCSGFLWIKLALQGLSPVQLGFGRLLAGATVLLTVAVVGRQRFPRLPALWVDPAVMAVAANIAPFVLYGWGIERITSGLAAVLSDDTPAGMAACLLGAAWYGGSFVYARRFLTGRGFSAFMLSTGQMAMGAVLLALAAPVVARGRVTLAPIVIASVLVLAVLGTGIAYVLYYRLPADEGPVAASLVTYPDSSHRGRPWCPGPPRAPHVEPPGRGGDRARRCRHRRGPAPQRRQPGLGPVRDRACGADAPFQPDRCASAAGQVTVAPNRRPSP